MLCVEESQVFSSTIEVLLLGPALYLVLQARPTSTKKYSRSVFIASAVVERMPYSSLSRLLLLLKQSCNASCDKILQSALYSAAGHSLYTHFTRPFPSFAEVTRPAKLHYITD